MLQSVKNTLFNNKKKILLSVNITTTYIPDFCLFYYGCIGNVFEVKVH